RNGAMIQLSPSSINPSGAIWASPFALIVVTIVSTIRGILLLLAGSFERGAFRGVLREILGLAVGGDTPIERAILRIAFGQRPRNLRLGELVAEVERVRAVLLHAELVEQLERIGSHMMTVAIVDVDVGRP